MNQKIQTALIGFGLAGRVFHAPVLLSTGKFSIRKIVTGNEENCKQAALLYPETTVLKDADDILQDEEIQLVVVATPNETHYSICKKALEAGKHVVVDKPFTVTTDEADELIALAGSKGCMLTVHQNRRWDSDFLTIRKVIESRSLGELVEYEAHFDRFRNTIKEGTWKEQDDPGSGILYDLGSHLIDQALVLFGIPNEVCAHLLVQRQSSRIIDNFEVILFYEQLKVTLKAGKLVKAKLPHFILLGNKGAFVKYGLDVQEEKMKDGFTPLTSAKWGEEPELIWGTLYSESNGNDEIKVIASEAGDYRLFYENVFEAIAHNKPLAVKPSEARNVIRIIELASKSHYEKRTVKVDGMIGG